MTNKYAPLPVTHLLSGAVTKQLADDLIAATTAPHDHFIGLWCKETGFACAVEVIAQTPCRWHFSGPFNELQAREWLGLSRQVMTSKLH